MDHTLGPAGKKSVYRLRPLFREKLIQEFNFEECDSAYNKRYNVRDIESDRALRFLLHRLPNAPINFRTYSATIVQGDRRKTRMRTKVTRYPPFELWAHWLITRKLFGYLMLVLIVLDGIIVGVGEEIGKTNTGKSDVIRALLAVEYCLLVFFILEIILRMLDCPRLFLKNIWNLIDCAVLLWSIFLEIWLVGSYLGLIRAGFHMYSLRSFRIIRSIRLIARVKKMRLILLAVMNAMHSVYSTTLLLFIFAYIFAISGMILFGEGYIKKADKLIYKDSFTSVGQSLLTLFRLLTLDHWSDIYSDVSSIVSKYIAITYIILWIVIGSYVFSNIIVGILVNNFQAIRQELFVEMEELRDVPRRSIQMARLADDLDRHKQLRVTFIERIRFNTAWRDDSRASSSSSGHLPRPENTLMFGHEFTHVLSQQHRVMDKHAQEWWAALQKNMPLIALDVSGLLWPRDSLLHYFLVMEALMENLFERHRLLELAAAALLDMCDIQGSKRELP